MIDMFWLAVKVTTGEINCVQLLIKPHYEMWYQSLKGLNNQLLNVVQPPSGLMGFKMQ